MLYLNEFWSADAAQKVTRLMERGYVIPSFLPIHGVVDTMVEKKMRILKISDGSVRTATFQRLTPIRGKKYGKGDLWQPQPTSIKVL
jgi:hypothetical protein